MSAERQDTGTIDRLRITDGDDDRLIASRFPDGQVTIRVESFTADAVGLTLDDGLALLSFLADALGVERYVPEQTPETTP